MGVSSIVLMCDVVRGGGSEAIAYVSKFSVLDGVDIRCRVRACRMAVHACSEDPLSEFVSISSHVGAVASDTLAVVSGGADVFVAVAAAGAVVDRLIAPVVRESGGVVELADDAASAT